MEYWLIPEATRYSAIVRSIAAALPDTDPVYAYRHRIPSYRRIPLWHPHPIEFIKIITGFKSFGQLNGTVSPEIEKDDTVAVNYRTGRFSILEP